MRIMNNTSISDYFSDRPEPTISTLIFPGALSFAGPAYTSQR